ncbi:MAG: AraC family transcriptional regulator [Saprospiraceae bacterium]|nr:AraC family transcriptional regulator [Saprospiraceae bacterium]
MIFTHLERPPHPALQPFVKAFWYLRIKSDTPLRPLNSTPIPEQCLYFYPKVKPQAYISDTQSMTASTAMIFGQGTIPAKLFVPQDYLMFKIIFQAGGFYRLFNTPLTLFTDKPQDSEAVFGKPMTDVRDQIEQTEDFEKMIKIAENYLFQKIKQIKTDALPLDSVMQQLNWEHQSLDKMARQACLSSRQFERKFLERIGVSPKFYGRIMRFNAAMKGRMQQPNKSLMHIAYDYGYFDHNHLLRDFKQFTGSVPTQFDLESALIY